MSGMRLIGQYDSPFVRRVGVALTLYGFEFVHERPSVFGNADEIAPINPLRRVPTLVMEDGLALTDSSLIIDALDDMVGRDRAMFPLTGQARREALQVTALACGVAEKAVSLIYEQVLHETVSQLWVDRCIAQIGETLDLLWAKWAERPGPYWSGDDIGHADIAMAAAWRFISDAHPDLAPAGLYPKLSAHSARCEALPAFIAISQPFSPPAKAAKP